MNSGAVSAAAVLCALLAAGSPAFGQEASGASAGAGAGATAGTQPEQAGDRPASLLDLAPEDVLEAARHGAGAGEDTPLPSESVIVASIGRGVAYLIESQNEDGSWGSWGEPADEFWSNPYSHFAWIEGTTGLVVMCLMEQPDNEAALAAADRGLAYLLAQPETRRPSDWDVDNTWGSVYGLDCMTTALANARYEDGELAPKLRAKAEQYVKELADYQTPTGGWGYYDFETLAKRPSWATSFETAAALVGLVHARDLGIALPENMLEAAVKGLARTRLGNGAYSYSLDAVPYHGLEWINNVKGSLARIQCANYALQLAGDESITRERVLTGLDQFFEHHRFLDVARKKPIPHEAYYLNSGYFYFFGHFYASRLLDTLDEPDRARYRVRLAREVVKTQEADGSMWDFYFNTYGRPYGTAFGVMTLVRTLPER